MSAVSPITRQTVGRTFTVAISILGLGALAQLAVILWFFMARFHVPPLPEGPGFPTGPGIATNGGTRSFADPFSDGVAPAPSTPATLPGPHPVTPLPKPTPISQQALIPVPQPTGQDRFNELMDQAKTLREHGDTYAAVTKLREAQATEPNNPMATAELAITYEKMGFVEKATENWNRIYEMGEGAGIYYTAAEGRRKESQAKVMKDAATTLTPPPTTALATPAPAAGPGEMVGLGPTSKLGLLDLSRKDEADPGATKKFTLEVPVKAKAHARIDVREVIVQVIFYDVVNGKTLDRTNAQVSFKWAQPPADWSDHDVETLEVSYLLPALHATDEERKYYGYIASVYYKNALQDFRSDPPALGQRLPPKRLLSTESSE